MIIYFLSKTMDSSAGEHGFSAGWHWPKDWKYAALRLSLLHFAVFSRNAALVGKYNSTGTDKFLAILLVRLQQLLATPFWNAARAFWNEAKGSTCWPTDVKANAVYATASQRFNSGPA